MKVLSKNIISKDIIIDNELGLHIRPAAMIAQIAQDAKSNVWIIKDTEQVDASSIVDILTLSCTKGTKITLKIEDHMDLNILNKIIELIEKGVE